MGHELIDEALHWLAIVRDGDCSDDERHAFESWVRTSDAHASAWQRACDVWNKSDALAATDAFAGVSLNASVLEDTAAPAVVPKAAARTGKALSRRQWMQMAAAGAAVAVPGYYIWTSGAFADYATGVGERRTVELPDRSVVEMGSSTVLNVDYRADTRRLSLERGEAYFRPRSGGARPFIVDARKGRIGTGGAAFNVKILDDATAVTAFKDTVDITLQDDASVSLGASRQVSFGGAGFSSPKRIDPNAVLAWRSGRIIFQDAPLRDVVADLERHRRGRIVILDESLGDALVTAVFKTSETTAAIDTIADIMSIRATWVTPYLVILSG